MIPTTMTNTREFVQRNELYQHGFLSGCGHVNAPKVICILADKRTSAGHKTALVLTSAIAFRKTQMFTIRLMH